MAKNDKIAGGILVVLFGYGLYMTASFPERSAYFPKFICIVGLLLSLILIALAFKKEKGGEDKEQKNKLLPTQKKRLILMAALIVFYVVAMQMIGFTVSTIAFMIAGSCMLYPGNLREEGKKPVFMILASSIVISVLIMLVFKKLLYVPLPAGMLF